MPRFTVSFFEEFPSQENLLKLRLVDFPTKLYLASKSYKEFLSIKNLAKKLNKNLKEVIWWPVLEKKDGYWISPFANPSAMRKLCSSLQDVNNDVMLDLELPIYKSLIVKNLFWFGRNKRLLQGCISNILKHNKVYTAEYLCSPHRNSILRRFGLSLNPAKHGSFMIKMFYSSMHDYNLRKIENFLKQYVKMYGKNFLLGLGVIARGVNNNENLLSPEGLERDLEFAKSLGVRKVIIFRLGGLNKKYVRAIDSVIE
ncbi:hypothetical protein DRN98_08280 [Methanosarcinales archaeon]|nr:MAG: hypothetical protein DRN98_08280 [Methanosarcinales archaeon]